METVRLSNGVEMPILGYGVFQIPLAETERCVCDAVGAGYRSIDTAQAYQNEEGVGRAIAHCGVPRSELFITTKVWISNAGEARAAESIHQSLRRLQTDYVDLLLIHQPFSDYYGTWRALEAAYKAGKARAIGVSNFYPDRLIDLAGFSDMQPMVNQVETHILNQQTEAQQVFAKYGCATMAWAPLGQGKVGLSTHPVLVEIGRKYGKTAVQVALRWFVQRHIIVIPKTTHRERMEENFRIFDFSLSDEDMAAIAALDEGRTLGLSHRDVKRVEFFVDYANNGSKGI